MITFTRTNMWRLTNAVKHGHVIMFFKSYLIMCVTLMCGSSRASRTFRQNFDFVNTTCPELSTTDLGYGRSAVHCGILCRTYPECYSFFFNDQTRSCMGLNEILTNLCHENVPGNRYYVTDIMVGTTCTSPVDCPIQNTTCDQGVCTCHVGLITDPLSNTACVAGVTNYGAQCSSAADCYGPYVECWSGTCTCKPGYSLKPDTKTCEPSCTAYGSTFNVYRDVTLACPGSTVLPNHSVRMCLDACLAADCRTMRYNLALTECKIDVCTPLTNPGDLMKYPGVDLYMRNCG